MKKKQKKNNKRSYISACLFYTVLAFTKGTPNELMSQPCGYIIISEDKLTFEFRNEYTDTVSTHQWEIEEVNWSGGQYFRLKILPEYVEGLFINQFCENYMYGDATPSDGNMYLYTKVD